MRNRVRIALALLPAVLLAGCSDKKAETSDAGGAGKPQASGGTASGGGASTDKKNRRIVFIFKVAGIAYSEACKRGAEQATKELGIQVDYLAPDKAEVGKQIAYMEKAIADKVDAIVIAPNDSKAIAPIIKKAMAANVKVFTWDSDAPNSERIFYVAAADDVQIGVDIAESLAKDINGKGKVMIVSGGRGADNLNLHVEGFEKGFAKYPGITLVKPYIYNDDDNQKARSMAVAALQKDPDIVGFACANSVSPPAVGEAVTTLNKIGKVKVWGLALPSESRQYLKSGAVQGVLLWDPAKLTAYTARAVNDYLDGKQPQDGVEVAEAGGKVSFRDGKLIIPGTTFTKENVDNYNF